MVKYECKKCEYITKNRSDYNKHCNTKKHVEKVNKSNNLIDAEKITNVLFQVTPNGLPDDSQKYVCEYCGKSISRYNNVNRHLASCQKKKDAIKELQSQIKNTENNMKDTVSNMKLKEQIKILNLKLRQSEDNAKYYKKMFMEAGSLVKKSVSSLTYVVDNYNNAPPLQTLTLDDINSIKNDNTEKQIVDDIISAYKHKTLGKYLGDFIIKLYKKNDPENQSIWNTDDTRLTYLIKELVNNKSSNWMVDRKGHKTTTYIIKPLLARIKEMLMEYHLTYGVPEVICNSVEMEFILDNSKKIMEIINDIDDGIISKDILKHISGHLKFNIKSIK